MGLTDRQWEAIRMAVTNRTLRQDRVAQADAAVRGYQSVAAPRHVGQKDRETVMDLLADLMHWCEQFGIDFADALVEAKVAYSDETTDLDTDLDSL